MSAREALSELGCHFMEAMQTESRAWRCDSASRRQFDLRTERQRWSRPAQSFRAESKSCWVLLDEEEDGLEESGVQSKSPVVVVKVVECERAGVNGVMVPALVLPLLEL